MNRDRGIKDTFFSGRNRTLLNDLVEKSLVKQLGEISETDKGRIGRSVDHYINEVYSVQGEKPVAFLNKEVVTATARDIIEKKKAASLAKKKKVSFGSTPLPVAATANEGFMSQQQQQQQQQHQQQTALGGTPIPNLYLESGQLFEELQKTRNESSKPVQSNIPDFTLHVDDDSRPSPVDLFNLIKAKRDEESVSVKVQPPGVSPRIDESLNTYIIAPQGQTELTQSSREKGIATANPTTSVPILTQLDPPFPQHLPQNTIIKEESKLEYYELESNLILSSADRNWLVNSAENRYNFSVNFDSGQRPFNGFGTSPSTQRKFKNIVRIEFVKAILPAESLDTLVYKDISSNTLTNIQTTALSFPQILLHVDELRANNIGTDEDLDNAFSILQYDAIWTSDSATGSKGYIAMIPKFLKCQRIYQPTPLATLQKMTLHLDRPNGKLLDSTADTFDISGIVGSEDAAVNLSKYYSSTGAPSEFIFIQTRKYFPHFMIQRGERIQIRGFTQYPGTPTASELAAINELNEFINREEGHLVCDLAYVDSLGNIVDGWNDVGYANYIIIKSKATDPTTGSVDPAAFGPSAADGTYALGQTVLTGRGINLNRQIQLVFRIITRELDATSQVRPDNLN